MPRKLKLAEVDKLLEESRLLSQEVSELCDDIEGQMVLDQLRFEAALHDFQNLDPRLVAQLVKTVIE